MDDFIKAIVAPIATLIAKSPWAVPIGTALVAIAAARYLLGAMRDLLELKKLARELAAVEGPSRGRVARLRKESKRSGIAVVVMAFVGLALGGYVTALRLQGASIEEKTVQTRTLQARCIGKNCGDDDYLLADPGFRFDLNRVEFEIMENLPAPGLENEHSVDKSSPERIDFHVLARPSDQAYASITARGKAVMVRER